MFWPTGNPSAEYNGDDRVGDNLYSDCILALDAKTGKLKWHYQTTPHDLWDWDATETPVVLDATWEGQPRKLLMQANRNGFFYVFDRTDGKLLLAKPFVTNLNWASGVGADGRPVKLPNMEPSAAGTTVCPSQDGATNWFSPSYNPATGLYYVQTFEKCSVYTKRDPGAWQAGKEYLGGSQRRGGEKPQRILKAIDIKTGKIAWTLPQPGPAESWGGTLGDGDRAGDFRRGRRGADGGRRGHRQTALEFPDEPDVEGVADDVPVRRQAVCGGGGGSEYHRVRDYAVDSCWQADSACPTLVSIGVLVAESMTITSSGALRYSSLRPTCCKPLKSDSSDAPSRSIMASGGRFTPAERADADEQDAIFLRREFEREIVSPLESVISTTGRSTKRPSESARSCHGQFPGFEFVVGEGEVGPASVVDGGAPASAGGGDVDRAARRLRRLRAPDRAATLSASAPPLPTTTA